MRCPRWPARDIPWMTRQVPNNREVFYRFLSAVTKYMCKHAFCPKERISGKIIWLTLPIQTTVDTFQCVIFNKDRWPAAASYWDFVCCVLHATVELHTVQPYMGTKYLRQYKLKAFPLAPYQAFLLFAHFIGSLGVPSFFLPTVLKFEAATSINAMKFLTSNWIKWQH